MATIDQGILGKFSGSIGPVVGSSWNGVGYVRARPRRKKKKAKSSPKQSKQRARFSLVSQFVGAVRPLIVITFKEPGLKRSGLNSAISYIMKNAITGQDTDLKIDHSLVHISRGFLPNVPSPRVAVSGQVIHFSWTSNVGTGIAKASDHAILVAYHGASNQAAYTIGPGFRGEKMAALEVKGLNNEEMETWLAFISDDGKEISPSVYTGRIRIGG